jgi:hypothetical protein
MRCIRFSLARFSLASFAAALVACAMTFAPKPALSQSREAQQPGAQQSQKSQQDLSHGQPQVFLGKIIQKGSTYVLKDTSTGARYELDDQTKASHYDGKNVTITGVLDPTSDIIRVNTIKADKS